VAVSLLALSLSSLLSSTAGCGSSKCGGAGNARAGECQADGTGGTNAGTGGGAGGGAVACTTREPGCCFRDGDCAAGEECVGAICTVTELNPGVCKMRPASSGGCWHNADCPSPPGVCTGAQVCPCGAACLVPDTLGTCGVR
jgi:hypothetical protein